MKSQTRVAWVVALGIAIRALAQDAPSFQASVVPGFSVHSPDQKIEGLTLSLWGENPQQAFSFGLVNGSTGSSEGFSLGLVNYAESYGGVHWGLVNATSGDFVGWQGGPLCGLVGSVVNFTGGKMNGFQSGVVNLAGTLSGLQLGVVNYAQRAESGVQIGVVNFIAENNGWFTRWPHEVAPGMLLVNWRF